MSWEVLRTENTPCDCGSGTQTFTFEMDDWNRTRISTEIHCASCRDRRDREQKEEQAKQKRRGELLDRAKQLVKERYLKRWLDSFVGMTKKAAWARYTGGAAYPSLGTFYQHLTHAGGLPQYMEWCLLNDLERSLQVLGVHDQEIEGLLKEHAGLWRPTNNSF
jgi:hypothetical protein